MQPQAQERNGWGLVLGRVLLLNAKRINVYSLDPRAITECLHQILWNANKILSEWLMALSLIIPNSTVTSNTSKNTSLLKYKEWWLMHSKQMPQGETCHWGHIIFRSILWCIFTANIDSYTYFSLKKKITCCSSRWGCSFTVSLNMRCAAVKSVYYSRTNRFIYGY